MRKTEHSGHRYDMIETDRWMLWFERDTYAQW